MRQLPVLEEILGNVREPLTPVKRFIGPLGNNRWGMNVHSPIHAPAVQHPAGLKENL